MRYRLSLFRLKKQFLIGLAMVMLACSVLAQEKAKSSAEAVPIGPGDLLDIQVFDSPELSGKFRVDNQGKVSLPLLNTVPLQGLAPEQAQQVLAKRLADSNIVKKPQVTVAVEEYGSAQAITVAGEVRKPGAYTPLGRPRLLEVISEAEGLTPDAAERALVTHRADPAHPVTVSLIGNSSQAAADIELQPGDMVLVPKAGIVYVVGDVAKPGGFAMDTDNVSVLQALALASGANRTAKLNSTRIIRKTTTGVTDIPVPLGKVFQSKSPDLALQAGDVLYVPSSAAKTAGALSSHAVLDMITGVALYGLFYH